MDLTSTKLALGSLKRRGATEQELEIALKLSSKIVDIKNKKNDDEQEASSCKDGKLEQIGLCCELGKSEKWECKAAAMLAAADVLNDDDQEQGGLEMNEMLQALTGQVVENMTGTEPRLRKCAVKVIEGLARIDAKHTWDNFAKPLYNSVDENFERDAEERKRAHKELALNDLKLKNKTQDANNSSATTTTDENKQENQNRPRADSASILHETIGWAALETSMRGLQHLIKGLGPNLVEQGYLKDGYVVNLCTKRALAHENRYVREVGYDLCAALATALCLFTKGTCSKDTDAIGEAVKLGLTDNWSQVRFAASVATRNLMTGLNPDQREKYYNELVPRMCLNRYYLAEGVRIYSQTTWRQVFPGEMGIEVVCKCIEHVVSYYCSQSEADNHGVREAACHSIAELSAKIGRESLGPHVSKLLDALLVCFQDDSWPVRDAACISTGQFVHNFPEESRPQLEQLWKLWIEHLSDNIWSVRRDAAQSLGLAMKVYGETCVDRVDQALPDLLSKVHQPDEDLHKGHKHDHHHDDFGDRTKPPPPPPSPPSSPRSLVGDSQPRGYVFVSREELERSRLEEDEHSNLQLFSCGSLAPKLKRGKGIGCMDHGYTRPTKNWEYTDGAIYLLCQLALYDVSRVDKHMQALSEIPRAPGAQPEIKVTLWKQLPALAKAMGKRPFKKHLEIFLPQMISNLQNENQLVAAASADCILFLMQYLGSGIFRGRVEGLLNGGHLWQVIEKSPLVQITNLPPTLSR